MEPLARAFCESPRRSLIVASVTTLVALVLGVPLADELYDKKMRCDALAEELVRARQTAEALPAFEQRVGALTGELASLEAREISEESLAAYRSKLVDIVRASGCQIRRIQLGSESARPWLEGDDPLQRAPAAGAKPTPFTLQRRSLVLSVDGSMGEVHDLLQRLEKEATLAHPRSMRIQPASRGGSSVTMELELWLFALARGKA
ncbi:MAG: hypothetical protein KDA61_22475 [Planctomycetales bacterium]|nr:hypothetical protein [Planctomycetales bacterium]